MSKITNDDLTQSGADAL